MADSYTGNLNLRKPEVGHAADAWGGTAGLNGDLDIIDAIFLATGLGTAVGLHVGPAQVLNVEGGITLKDPVDTTKVAVLDRSLITTATVRTYQFPDQDGVLALKSHVPTGTVFSGYYGNTAPLGFVFVAGRTIGDAGSGATERANADTGALFTLLWNLGFTPSGGRGASAAADFAAHKTMPLPNHSGRAMAGRDNLSGTAAGVLPGYNSVGAAGGVYQTSARVFGIVDANGSIRNDGANLAYTNGLATAGSTTGGWNIQGGGSGPVSDQLHQHVVSGNANVFANVDVSGSIRNDGNNNTATFTTVQPTIAVDVIIAL